MNRNDAKKRLETLSTGVCKKILVDYTRLLYESRGMYMVDADIEFAIIVDGYTQKLENIYKKEIGDEGPEIKIRDLEELIESIKTGKE